MQKYSLNIRNLTWLILLFCLTAKSQVLQWSNPTKLKGAAVYTQVIGENEAGVFLLRYRNRFYSKNVIIEQYNHHLALEQSKTFDLKNARLVKLYLLQNSILFVKSSFSKSNQTNQLIAQHYSFDFKPKGQPIILAEADVTGWQALPGRTSVCVPGRCCGETGRFPRQSVFCLNSWYFRARMDVETVTASRGACNRPNAGVAGTA